VFYSSVGAGLRAIYASAHSQILTAFARKALNTRKAS